MDLMNLANLLFLLDFLETPVKSIMGATEVRQSEASGKFMRQLSRALCLKIRHNGYAPKNIDFKGDDDG
jgi:hypothetical protein